MAFRDLAQKVIADTLRSLPGDASLFDKKKALTAVYSFGQRKYWPYRVWLEECGFALGHKQRKPRGKRAQAGPTRSDLELKLASWGGTRGPDTAA